MKMSQKVEIWKGLEERIGIGEDPGAAEVKQGRSGIEIWKGLEERIGIGEDPGGAEVKQGRSGIAASYENEPKS